MRKTLKITTTRDLRTLKEDPAGLSTVEYIIILVLIAVLAITVWRSFGEAVQENVEHSTEQVGNLRGGGS